ncbi:sensor histidine kinase [Ornithinimicrobium sp. Y1694]|uniref:sensor histidine kinase n=1 Tax=Ornithinimicrobium sp. Y1694 TaxID=3418590 RepID=UPI003CF11EC6
MERLERWFGADEDWERVPTALDRRRDLQWALVAFLVVAFGTEMIRSGGGLVDEPLGIGWQYVGIASAAVLVALRRVAPITVMLLACAHFVIVGQLMPMTMSSLPMQLLSFFLFFSGVAWARNRRAVVLATGAVLLVMALWLAWWFALGAGLQNIRDQLGEDVDYSGGLVTPITAILMLMAMGNAIYFGFAIALGQVAWRGALRNAQTLAQARTIEEQSAALTDQAVVAERLRIARELHDVVAHHVSVMGVQTAAARRVMDRDPESAKEALAAVESSSREAVGQMRQLLGTLRADADGEDRSPQPTLADLLALAESASTQTLTATVEVVESSPGAAARVPPPVQLSAYRVVQESLANVHKHSTARTVRAVVRVDESTGRVEVEVVDDGHQRVGTSGTGLGLLGMRERAQHLGGGVEVGPRRGALGWRVRVWFPLDGRPMAVTGASQGAAAAASGQPSPAARQGERPGGRRQPADDAAARSAGGE